MTLYTIGFTQKSARDFFEILKKNNIDLLIDIRINNQSQLAGFSKGRDLEYFLKEIVGCQYEHQIIYAPTKELLDDYKKNKIDWLQYTEIFDGLIKKRKMVEHFAKNYLDKGNVVLLCSEPVPD